MLGIYFVLHSSSKVLQFHAICSEVKQVAGQNIFIQVALSHLLGVYKSSGGVKISLHSRICWVVNYQLMTCQPNSGSLVGLQQLNWILNDATKTCFQPYYLAQIYAKQSDLLFF